MAYAAKIMQQHGLLKGVTLYLSASVMEEELRGSPPTLLTVSAA
jgi:hypothetical protein